MKSTTEHPPIEDLVSMLAGELSAEHSERLIEHAGNCERCEHRIEKIWAEVSPLADRPPVTMDDDLSAAAEERLLLRLQRTHFAENVAGFGTQGFFYVILGLLRPLIHVLIGTNPQPAGRR